MKFDENAVEQIYQENLSSARLLLSSLSVAEGREPTTKGLTGWVYEQTIRHCLSGELREYGLTPKIEEQVPLYGRTKVDLLVDKVAIEIKALGIFGNDLRKYSGYRLKSEEKGWSYLYVTRAESYKPYRTAMQSAFGNECAFFLDTDGEWARFISAIIRISKP
jgi:hypothetical protein